MAGESSSSRSVGPQEGGGAQPMRGRAALEGIRVLQQQGLLARLYHLYTHMLRMSLPTFFLCLLSGAPLLSLVFTGLYLLDPEGLRIAYGGYQPSGWTRAIVDVVGETRLHVFFYSLSLSTTLGGGAVEVQSPYAVLIANLNTLCAQLLFVFLSGAVFQRLAQPVPPVRFSKVALIAQDTLANAFSDEGSGPKPKAFLARCVLVGPSPHCLIDAKFDLSMRRFVKVPGQDSHFAMHAKLPLVRAEASYLRYGMLLRHIIDESSPLYGRCDQETLLAEDASFSLTVNAFERSSMQPVFGHALYSVHDGDVFWDREFEDLILLSPTTKALQMTHGRLSALKPYSAPPPSPPTEDGTRVRRDAALRGVRVGNTDHTIGRVGSETLSPGV